ncbi:hypothetical protein [Flavobacterium terrisoli]|uniref:hypothetical protein n=1 Tax=Flavobacterium terrisoli TaxID=3242195 RepID=UPI002542DCA3|nr:hypothetical protein [Flavobacterium buctense]
MKPFFLFFLFFFNGAIGFAQSEKIIHGKILFGEKALSAIDIVNLNSRESTITDKDGHFSINAKIKDTLFIISKEYNDRRIALTKELLDQKNLILYLEKKPIELDEVGIVGIKNQKITIQQADLDKIKLEKQARTLKVPNVYTGEIENGVDFIRLGKDIIGLFKNKDKDKSQKPLPPISFRDYLTTHFDTNFYTQKLKLKPEEISLFISFCEADPKAKIISQHQDILEATGFLISKKEEFQKLER